MENQELHCTVSFDSQEDKDKAFHYLVHSKTTFTGVDKNTLIIKKADCDALRDKGIKVSYTKTH